MSGPRTRPRPRFDPNLNLYHVLDVPVTYGLVRLDGADTVFLHVVLDAGDEPLEIGERVQAVLKPEADRTASILDVEGFRPERSDD